uniref:Uncharacterized protein n=1 Tax=Plectus sambesii TaxID=2011161 RepID=A0A914WQ36_9BILA
MMGMDPLCYKREKKKLVNILVRELSCIISFSHICFFTDCTSCNTNIMWSLPLVAVLVAFACASPIPQASENAIGSSTLRSELSSTESSLSSISSSQSTEHTTPTRHTLRPFSFSPRTLKTHQPTSHQTTTHHTFKPLGGAKHTTTPVASESTSTISSAAETTSALNRLGRAANVESWQLAESTSTAKVDEISTPSVAPHALEQSSTSAATTPAVLIGEESTSASTPSTTTLPVRSVRGVRQWNEPEWQLAESSSTASISSSAATPASALGEELTSASTPSTTSLPVRALEETSSSVVTPAAGHIGAESTTTSALPVRSVRNAPEWAQPGWQLAETSSTVGIDASTTSALNDTSSTPAIGNMEDAPWQIEEASSTIEAESTSSISPAVEMSNDDRAPWPQMEESSSTFQAESTSAIPSPAMDNSMDGDNWA